jgi:hypothetical protein
VNWFVLQKPITISESQLVQYYQIAGNSGFLPNNRPTQPLDGRILNQFNNDVFTTGGTVSGVDFSIAPNG